MSRTTLAENVADVLRHAIYQGVYLSGERLVELTIAQEMNVSQNTVRDALRLLQHDGLVEKRARLGTYVRSHNPEEAEEMYALWLALESLVLQWAMTRIIPAQVALLHELASDYAACVDADRRREAQEKRFQFHRLIAQVSGKSQTAALLRQVRNQIRLLENVRYAPHPEHLPSHYESLVDAIRAKDPTAAQKHLRACIQDNQYAAAE